MFDKILVPLVGEDLDNLILHQVRRLLTESKARLLLLRVLPDEYEVEGEAAERRRVVEKVTNNLEQARKELATQGVDVETRLVYGFAAEEILRAIASDQPSLVAMSTHARQGFKRFMLGSVAERVLRRSAAPVLVTSRYVEEGTGVFGRRILVPLDGFELSSEILPLVEKMGEIHESEIVLIHVAPLHPYADYAEFETRSPESIEALLAPHVARLEAAGLTVRTRVEYGDPTTEILNAARTEPVDLIAMTTHGRKGPARWVFGSVAEEVLRHSPCPLLVNRTAGFAPGVEVDPG